MTTRADVDRALEAGAPTLGGFSPAVLLIEVRRLVRNRRTLIFTLVIPVFFFLLFGLNYQYADASAGNVNVSAYIMVSMALYGAILATSSGGAVVSIERAAGWSRQLRLTPLTPVAYIVTKMLTSLVLGFLSVTSVFVTGILTGKPSMPLHLWIIAGLSVWIGSLLFSAYGLFIGYLLPSENVMQIMSFTLMIFAFGGGLFVPLDQFPQVIQDVAMYTPLYGLNQWVHAPLTGDPILWAWTVNVAAWLAIFVSGAVWRFRRDTARV